MRPPEARQNRTPPAGRTQKPARGPRVHPKRQGPEIELVREMIGYLRARGHIAWRNNTGAARYPAGEGVRWVRFGPPGGADILGVVHPEGTALAVEVKAGNNRPTRAQAEFLAAIGQAGGIGITARSLPELETKLDEQRELGSTQRRLRARYGTRYGAQT